MATGVYSGISSVARKVKKLYFGSAGIAKQVKKGYIGVNGLARLFYSGRAVEALPYRFDGDFNTASEGGSGYSPVIIGPMNPNTFVRYGADVRLSQQISDIQPAVTREHIVVRLGRKITDYQNAATFDPQNGARINYKTFGTAESARSSAGCSNFAVFEQLGSNYAGDILNTVLDPVTLTTENRFRTTYNARWFGGHDNTVFCYEAFQDDDAGGSEYDPASGAYIRDIFGIGGIYSREIHTLDGTGGVLYIFGGNSAWGTVNYSTLSFISKIPTSYYPLYKGYYYGRYSSFKA